jgi:hypothetical protein
MMTSLPSYSSDFFTSLSGLFTPSNPAPEPASNSAPNPVPNPAPKQVVIDPVALNNFPQIELIKSLTRRILSPSPSSSDPSCPALSSGPACVADVVSGIRPLINCDLLSSGPVASTVGFMTVGNAVQGLEAAYKAGVHFMESREIDDFKGAVNALIDGIRSVGQSLGGAIYLPERILDIVLQVQGLSASSVLGSVAFGIGAAGSACFMLFGMAMSALGVFSLWENCHMDAKLSLVWGAKDKSEIDWFRDIMQVLTDSNAKLQRLTDKSKLQDKKQQWKEGALDYLTDQVMEAQKTAPPLAAGQKPLSKEEVRAFFTELFEQRGGEFNRIKSEYADSMELTAGNANQLTVLELIGFKLAEDKRSLRGRAKLVRATSAECVEAIEKAAKRGLLQRLQSDKASVSTAAKLKVTKLKEMVGSANTTNKVLQVGFVIFGILTTLSCLLPLITSSPVWSLVTSVIFMAGSGGWTLVDGHFAKEGLSKAPPGAYDKERIKILFCFILVMLAVSTGLTLGYGLPLIPLILALVFGFIGLNLCTAAFVQVHKNELEWEKNHPDKDRLRECLLSTPVPTGTGRSLTEQEVEIFKKLPEKDRETVRAHYPGLPFKTASYRGWDQGRDFGGVFIEKVKDYLDETKPNKEINETEFGWFKSAAKEATQRAWKKYAVEKSEANKAIALKMERLSAALKSGNNKVEINAALLEITQNRAAFELLKEEVWFAVKLRESAGDLFDVVQKKLIEPPPPNRAVPPLRSPEEAEGQQGDLVGGIRSVLQPQPAQPARSQIVNDDSDTESI